MIDGTASGLGVTYQNDSPLSAGDTCYVVLSLTGPLGTLALDALGTSLNIGYDVFTEASFGIAIASSPAINSDAVGASGSVQFPFFPNVTQLLGLPLWGIGFTATSVGAPGRFTDPILFQ